LNHQLKGSFDGFRFVLIGDMHEQPMLHLRVKPFIIGAKDWSGEVCTSDRFPSSRAYRNKAASHDHPGDSNQLLESDELPLGAM